MILGIQITNYDVFEDETIGLMMEQSLEQMGDSKCRLRNLNALIGRNNTGKTSFLMAMSFVKRCLNQGVAEASKADGRPGFSNLIMDGGKTSDFKIFFRVKDAVEKKTIFMQYELSLAATKFGSPVVRSEKVLKSHKDGTIEELMNLTDGVGTVMGSEAQITDEHLTALSVYGKIALLKDLALLYKEIDGWFFCRFSAEMSNTYYMDGNAPGGHSHLSSSGANVNNVLEYMESEDPVKYEKMIIDITSKIPQMRVKKTLPKNLDASPDKLFLYLLLMREKNPHTTIFMETPDRDLYHDMVDVLAQEMREFSLNNPYCQIIFTTHNPYIIESMTPNEVWVFRREYGEEEDTNVSVFCAGSDKVVDALAKEGVGMGAIWYGGHLDSESDDAY